MTPVADRSLSMLGEQVERLLVCPRCTSRFAVTDGQVVCQNRACGFVGMLADDVALFGDRSQLSFFDDRHGVMTSVTTTRSIRCLCYDAQGQLVENLLRPGQLVLDVGCGPTLPYVKPKDTFVIGLEASFESIRANHDVDLRVYGTAAELPLPDQSVDTILAFYAVHHMTGTTVAQNRRMAVKVFREFGRVVKPGGELLVFEVSPWRPFWVAEKHLWNAARAVIGHRLDMFFYSERAYEALGRAAIPEAEFSTQRFGTSMLSLFPPAFSLPWLQIPRFLYPFAVNLYRWRF